MTTEKRVHWIENVDGDASRVRTACGELEWVWDRELLDPNRTAIYPVTCSECLAAMADQPIIVESK